MAPTTIGKPPSEPPRLPEWLGGLLCRLGVHQNQVIDASFGFAPGETIERVQCRRCGTVTTRRGRR